MVGAGSDPTWVGWNTQEPHPLEHLVRGATLRIHAIEGPGEVVTYLQGGNFSAPQQLWSSRAPFPQEAWVEVNTHTHANWVFSQSGVYLIDMEFAGELIDGEALSARGTLRFAVGDETDPVTAFSAALAPTTTAATEAGAAAIPPTTAEGPAVPWMLVAAGAAALVAAIGVVSVTSARARRRAQPESGA